MWRRAGLVLLAATLACHHQRSPRVAKAPHAPARSPSTGGPGGFTDDGAGDLAQQSIQLSFDTTATAEDSTVQTAGRTPPRRYVPDADVQPDADELANMTYAGRTYAKWQPPQTNTTVARAPRYTVGSDLRGAIDGAITWGGAQAGRLATPCGLVDNPSVRVDAATRGLADTIVYIEHVSVGRNQLPSAISHPPPVGGTLVRRGCTLKPAAQLATPVPVELAITSETPLHLVATTVPTGAATAAPIAALANRLSPTNHTPAAAHTAPPTATTTSAADRTPLDLVAGGRAIVALSTTGATRVDAADGAAVTPAWVLAIDSPYFAITDDAGRFRIDDLAPGRYDLVIWHAPLVTAGPDGKLVAGAPIVVRQTVAVGPSTPARVAVVLGR